MTLFSLTTVALAAGDATERFTSLLSENVRSGKVNYTQLCKDPRLEEYVSFLKSADPEQISNQKDRLALWINAYNVYTLKVICDHYPLKSINDLHSGGLILGSVFNTTVWDKDFVVVNHKPMTLNQIEHKIIRPVFREPRAHFALVCASKSCPTLRPEAFEGSKLDQQLDDQARIFLSDPKKNRFVLTGHKAYISKIFDWYGKDFGKNNQEILLYLSHFVPDEVAKAIRSAPSKWKIEYTDYDWNLNE